MTVFSSHKNAHQEAGLFLVGLWTQSDDRTVIHYLFDVRDYDKALAFINAPDAAEAAQAAGVMGGEFHFVETRNGY
jgi:pterin-4a-carbinolamine dehydratase